MSAKATKRHWCLVPHKDGRSEELVFLEEATGRRLSTVSSIVLSDDDAGAFV
jgi:hypothetical protein